MANDTMRGTLRSFRVLPLLLTPKGTVFPWSVTVSFFLAVVSMWIGAAGCQTQGVSTAERLGQGRVGPRSRGRARAPAAREQEQEMIKCGCSNGHLPPRTQTRGKGSGTPSHRLLLLRFFFIVSMEATSVKGLEEENENESVPHTDFYQFEIEKLVKTIMFCLMQTYSKLGQRKG